MKLAKDKTCIQTKLTVAWSGALRHGEPLATVTIRIVSPNDRERRITSNRIQYLAKLLRLGAHTAGDRRRVSYDRFHIA